ncbi:MAG: 30S ribosome-binding factor RbfA [Pseudomonadales bacterium]|jgi:ribosome-binding factor A|nr:30S ribosome-binding factor RbfA [Pseudomonadales bacterium]MDP7145396.1 30S ribosome-binding factor RbfA [Pseudomonadales bacterium]MDP7359575.1 30S ribosome-binding factor RbfA [Pseudomonadales bacterium]MDP7595824.1 30S ribosome-binding factor RbfA [Pseudomonadales bacterium]HJN49944.1 30S ribosome-binding factor RbfA [Pseudomonadales bacterium]|tara:strand:- start:5128 stop:5544 length:417 start_codon:yes stop_codon:yes gene_type:complete
MPKEFSRGQRIADLIQRELAQLILRELRDPRLGMVTINEVKASRDLAFADVYITLLNEESSEDREGCLDVLNKAQGFLRSQLARILKTRTTPKLRFHYDNSVADGQYLSKLIDAAVHEDNSRRPSAEREKIEEKPEKR